jgi:aminotransferase in exopolysaccharide biosynthesis
VGVESGTEVITQALTFVATANAIQYHGAKPVFIDVDRDTMGMSPDSLVDFLENHAYQKEGECWNRSTNRRIMACIPMHTLGHPCRIDKIKEICQKYRIELVEDAAESLGSYIGTKHTGTFGRLGVLSFNGNKVITCGGGGMILTNDEFLAKRAKHITTTAKVDHPGEFIHDEVGYNYRMPNLNAALGVAQLEQLPKILKNKRETAMRYRKFFDDFEIDFIQEPKGTKSNYWLNAIRFADRTQRDAFLKLSNDSDVMSRCFWKPMDQLDIYKDCQKAKLSNTEYLYDRVVNLPSSVLEI